MNEAVRVMRKLGVGGRRRRDRVVLAVGARVGQAKRVGRARVGGAGDVARIVVGKIRVNTPIGNAAKLHIDKELRHTIAIDVGTSNEAAEVVVRGIIAHVEAMDEVIPRGVRG